MPPEPWTATYLEAAGSFADLVASLPAPLSGPGLGEWDLRALVGHTARSLVTVSEYLRKPAPSVDVETATDYVAGLRRGLVRSRRRPAWRRGRRAARRRPGGRRSGSCSTPCETTWPAPTPTR